MPSPQQCAIAINIKDEFAGRTYAR